MIDAYDAWSPHCPVAADVLAASELEEHHRRLLCDAVIVVAAQRCERTTVLAEDLQDGRPFDAVSVVNTFDAP